VAASPDGRRALSAGRDTQLRLWDLASGQCVRKFDGHAESVRTVAWSRDGRWALSGSQDKTLRLWDVESGRAVWTETLTGWALSVALSADSRTALVGTYDRKVLVYDLDFAPAATR
jgi:WD40 repeat protein